MTLSQQVQRLDGVRFSDAGNTTSPIFRTPIGDEVPAIALAFSTRALRSTYLGPIIRVRRASDNAERDFTVGGAALTAAITAFLGGADGFVPVWFDQSGAGRHLAQNDPALQPKIATAGVVEKINGIPILTFIGGSGARRMLTGQAADLYGAAGSSVAILTGNHTGQLGIVALERNTGSSQYTYAQQATSYTLTGAVRNNAGTFLAPAGTVNEDPDMFRPSGPSQATIIDTSTVLRKRVRGAQLADVAYERTGALTSTIHNVGAQSETGNGWSGGIAEIIASRAVWSDAVRDKVEASQRTYAGI